MSDDKTFSRKKKFKRLCNGNSRNRFMYIRVGIHNNANRPDSSIPAVNWY